MYQLHKIVGKTDLHQVVSQSALVEVLPSVPLFAKVCLRKKAAPCQLKFDYLDNVAYSGNGDLILIDLSVLVSLEDPFPSEETCTHHRQMPSMVVVYEREGVAEEFEENWLYLKFFSKKGINVKFRASFPCQRPEKKGLPYLPQVQTKKEPEFFEELWFPKQYNQDQSSKINANREKVTSWK